MFRTFFINRNHLYLIWIITLLLVRGYLAEMCTLLGKFSSSLLVTLSCDDLSYAIGWISDVPALLDYFSCFMVDISCLKKEFILFMLALGKESILLLIFLVTSLIF
jgi:hypothetical protein